MSGASGNSLAMKLQTFPLPKVVVFIELRAIYGNRTIQLYGGPATYSLAYHQTTRGKSLASVTLQIEGMHCGSCVRRVSQTLASVNGVVVDEVRIGAARVNSSTDPAPVESIISALAKAGYTAHLQN
jgi:copper chaperone CopZ